jgi:hypothetical protein
MMGALVIVFLIIGFWLTFEVHSRKQRKLRKASRMKIFINPEDPPMKFLATLAYSFLGISLIDLIDYGIRWTAAGLGILLTVYLIQKTIVSTRVEKLKEQQLKSQLGRNKLEPEDQSTE